MKRLKIGINGRFLLKPFTGIGVYLRGVLSEMVAAHPEVDFVIVSEEKVDINWGDNVTWVIVPEIAWMKSINAGLAKTFWEWRQFKKALRHAKVDVAFVPYPSVYFDSKVPGVETVHDTIPWTSKEYARASFLGRFYHWWTRRRVKKMNKVLAVSQTTAEALKPFSEEVEVTYNSRGPLGERDAGILKKYGIEPESKFLFYLGGYDPRKNVKRLLKIHQQYLKDYPLVLGGGKVLENGFYDSFDGLERMENVVRTGFIEDADIDAFYANCACFVHLSQAEGFNLPLQDALFNGCPVVVSDLPIHREVAGGCAAFVDLEKKDAEIAKTFLNTMHNAKQYQWKPLATWRETAEKTFEILKSIA